MSQEAMALLSAAWRDKQGFVFLSVRDPSKDKHSPGYWKDLAFEWPHDRESIENILDKATRSSKDVYWAPAMFKEPRRQENAMLPTDLLWSDLDEADPREFPKDLRPLAWWESSPGRFQAVWRLPKELPRKKQTDYNKRLTYAVGADKGGWDATQVLRLPGLPNNKYSDVTVSRPHINGAHPVNLELLRTFEAGGVSEFSEDPIPEGDLPPPDLILKTRKIPTRARQLLKAKPANAVEGQRSERLWELECLLAEAHLTVPEIVSLTKTSVWNKFAGRHDEHKRLAVEARKAIAHTGNQRPVESQPSDGEVGEEYEEEDSRPLSWQEFDRDHKPIKWLVADVWAESEVGFISGTPKTYKSWLSLDLAVSVATGTRFLGSFAAEKKRVLLIQEEDPKVVTQDRLLRVAWARGLAYAKLEDDGSVEMRYDLPENLYIMSNQGFQITDESWMDQLKAWIEELEIDLVILDPLMMIAEGMDEFKAFDMMTKVLKPLKRLRADTKAAICVVHHHIKTSEKKGASAMYGSVALWAWEESALHLDLVAPGKVIADRFSKHARLTPITIEVQDISDTEGWKPSVFAGGSGGTHDLMDLLDTSPQGLTLEELEEVTGLSRDALQRQLSKLKEQGKVEEGRAPATPGQKGRRKKTFKVPD